MKVIKCKEFPYERFDLQNCVKALDAFKNDVKTVKSADDVIKARIEFLKTIDVYATASAIANTRYDLNAYDDFYRGEKEYYDEISPSVDGMISEYCKILLASPFREELEKILPETLFKLYECTVKSHDKIIEDDEREENALVTEYADLMAKLTVEFKGEKRTISFIRGFMEDSDRNTRREAAEAIGKALESVSDKLDDIYDKLVKVRTRMAKKLGFKNYVKLGYLRMDRIDYDENTVRTFRQNVFEDVVPVVTKMKNDIKTALGIETMYFYDNEITETPDVPVPQVNGNDLLKAAVSMYEEMSPTTGEFMKEMLEAEAFDTEARDGKWGGGYCTAFPDYKQPFILANFNGSSGDVDVVTHEFGHALADKFCFDGGDSEVSVGSMETAETHSMSMEFFAWKYADKFFKNVDEYKIKHLESCLTFIPYGVIVDEFQHIVYENPDMTPAERNKIYLELEKKYRPYMTFEGIPYLEKGTRWQYQMHIYESPFYYIDYCLAQVVALEFLVESQKDYDGALQRYFEHVKRGGRYPFSKLIDLAGLKSPFKHGALKEVFENALGILNSLRK